MQPSSVRLISLSPSSCSDISSQEVNIVALPSEQYPLLTLYELLDGSLGNFSHRVISLLIRSQLLCCFNARKTQLVEPASLDTSVNMTYIDLNMRSTLGPKSCLGRETEIMGKSSFCASLVYLW